MGSMQGGDSTTEGRSDIHNMLDVILDKMEIKRKLGDSGLVGAHAPVIQRNVEDIFLDIDRIESLTDNHGIDKSSFY